MIPTVTIVIPQQLRNYTGGAREVTAAGRTVDDALTHLDGRFPGIRFRVVDEQNRIRRHMRIFVDGARVTAIDAPVRAEGEVHIFGALTGG